MTAAPRDRETTARVRHNADMPPPHPEGAPVEGTWVELADPSPARHGEVFIPVGAEAGRFARLRVEVATGRPRIVQLRLEYGDGTRRVVRVEATLSTRRPAVSVDLAGARELAQIVVVTDRSSRGSYTVHGEVAADDGVASR